MTEPRHPSRVPALLLGVGLGGFVDGIVLHQLLQWHHVVSDVPGRSPTTVAGLEANTLADGLFHAVSWVFVLIGSVVIMMRINPLLTLVTMAAAPVFLRYRPVPL